MTNHEFVEPTGAVSTQWIDQLLNEVSGRGRRAGDRIIDAVDEGSTITPADKIAAIRKHPEYQLCAELDETVGSAIRCTNPGYGHLHHKWMGAAMMTMAKMG